MSAAKVFLNGVFNDLKNMQRKLATLRGHLDNDEVCNIIQADLHLLDVEKLITGVLSKHEKGKDNTQKSKQKSKTKKSDKDKQVKIYS